MLMPTFSGAAIYTAEEKYQKVKLENIKKNDLIFWRGDVAINLSKNKFDKTT